MMEANDVLLGTMLRDRLRVLSQIEEPCPKVEEFYLTTSVPDTAQEIGR
jgi:hypothetical protein